MTSGDLTTHRGAKVILGPEYPKAKIIANSARRRGKPTDKWFSYIVIEPDVRFGDRGAAPESEFGS